MKFSLIIPAYNEEKRILRTLNEYYAALKATFNEDFEIIIEMDGCTDRTPQVVRNFAQDKENVKILEFPKRLGKGGGLLQAFKVAKGEIIGFTDADGSTPAKEYIRLIRTINKGYDVIIGSRWLPESKVTIPQPLIRRILSRGFNLLVRLLFNLNIRDTQCGAKVFRREVIESAIPYIKIGGFAFDVELLYIAKTMGFKIKEEPIEWHNEKESKLNLKSVVPRMFIDIIKLRIRTIRFR
ncbi:dolichyl-phosphate beta-glucosyltransferase [Thermococcus barophilus]|uniref:dolichyl-phosphate beta-glucosyltransferase n=1 Tax=Thermococcus barophilus (strain DSM 11836 / MP) TaxID=391623 RepID=F0LLT5_THEBM|nr:dolichyl-phosphate beta-glucosyltransferase [Thermococcus barophilus]ADT83862.1 glycosyl transferase family 2 [Thermococcus barophilus MP]